MSALFVPPAAEGQGSRAIRVDRLSAMRYRAACKRPDVLVLLYTSLTALLFPGMLWSTRVGCLLPVALFFALWAAGEVLAGLAPLERIGR